MSHPKTEVPLTHGSIIVLNPLNNQGALYEEATRF